MSESALLILVFLAGLLGGLALYGRRRERRAAMARRADRREELEASEDPPELDLLPPESAPSAEAEA